MGIERVSYGDYDVYQSDLIPHLTSLYEEFSIEYEHMIIVFPKEVLPEKIKLPFDDYFLIVYR